MVCEGAPNLSVSCSWLYLGGTLSSAMSVLLLMRLGSYFLGGKAFVFQAELYVGLLMFIGYVLFDTQVWYPSQCMPKIGCLQSMACMSHVVCPVNRLLQQLMHMLHGHVQLSIMLIAAWLCTACTCWGVQL